MWIFLVCVLALICLNTSSRLSLLMWSSSFRFISSLRFSYRFFFVVETAVQEEGSTAKRSTLCISLQRKEDSYNGWHSIHRYLLVQAPCQRRTSGSSSFLFPNQSNCLLVSFSHWLIDQWLLLQVTLFTRGKSPIAKQLPGESDQDFADFSSKVLLHSLWKNIEELDEQLLEWMFFFC